MFDVDRSPRPPDYFLLALVGGMALFGLVMIYSASFIEAHRLFDNPFYYFLRQLGGVIVGGILMVATTWLHFDWWRRWSVVLISLAILLLVLVLPYAELTDTAVNGSRSWFRFSGPLGLISFQPSEFAKLALLVYLAHWLAGRSEKLQNLVTGPLPFAALITLIVFLLLLEPDLGTAAVIVLISGAVYFAAGANLRHIFAFIGLGVTGVWGLIGLLDFAGRQNMRIEAFRDPFRYADSFGYQPIHALYALGSGGIFGVGLGESRQKFEWLPQAHTDTILAIIGEELGLIGAGLVVIVYGLIAARGYRIAARAPDRFSALLAVGITSWITIQAIVNICVTVSLVPFTGLTLPFLSYGSSSLVSSMLGIGILLNISRHLDEREDEESFDAAPRRASVHRPFAAVLALWRRDGRARLSGLGSRRGAARPFRPRR